MEITKLSTKGQIVIPENLREGLVVGTSFTVTKKGDIIVLKKVEGLTEEEMEEMEELNEIWKEIDSGKGLTKSKEEFLKEMNAW